MIIIAETALELLQRAVDQRGSDFVYGQAYPETDGICQYAVHGQPACIAGLALSYVVPLNPHWEGFTVDLIRDLPATPRALGVLAVAQRVQDHNGTWGAALNAARAFYNKYTDENTNTLEALRFGVIDGRAYYTPCTIAASHA